jgi:hypothetical protein
MRWRSYLTSYPASAELPFGTLDYNREDIKMSVSTILLIILVLLLVGALPTWPYSGGWGYYPSGGLGLVLIVLLVLMVSGRL